MSRLSKTLIVAALSVALSGPLSGFAALWRSTDFRCSVNLPDSDSRTERWAVLTPNDILAQETGLVGARKMDSTAIVYLGIVRLDDKPHFQLNEKSVEQLEGKIFGTGLGFKHAAKPISRNGMNGIRLTGTHRYLGNTYNIVMDLFQANGMIYELAGLTERELDPLNDRDVKWFMDSFRLSR
jgi:hypothetical protein